MAAKTNIKTQVYKTIKDRLINCVYPPGSFLNEAKLAEDLGCSRTPVREAISRLEIDGLVEVVPKKGIYVSNVSMSDVTQIFQTRLEIEPLTIRMAISSLPLEELMNFKQKFNEELKDITNGFRLDMAMHLFIIEHCGNRYLIDMMNRLFEDNTRVIISSKQNEVQIHDARKEHLAILDALIEQDADKASELMTEHVKNCRNAAFDYFYNQPVGISTGETSYKRLLDRL